jgi:uncharacterized protein YaiI (UPF0178 family)
MLDLFVDIDNCPVFPQIVRAAQRHLLDVYVVTCDYLVADGNVHLIVAQDDDTGACEWIGTNISQGDICVTTDLTLATSCLLRGAIGLAPTGRMWTTDLINAANGAASAGRAGAGKLRNAGIVDPRAFVQRLEITIAAMRTADRRPAQRASAFGYFGLEPAVRPFSGPRSAVG